MSWVSLSWCIVMFLVLNIYSAVLPNTCQIFVEYTHTAYPWRRDKPYLNSGSKSGAVWENAKGGEIVSSGPDGQRILLGRHWPWRVWNQPTDDFGETGLDKAWMCSSQGLDRAVWYVTGGVGFLRWQAEELQAVGDYWGMSCKMWHNLPAPGQDLEICVFCH